MEMPYSMHIEFLEEPLSSPQPDLIVPDGHREMMREPVVAQTSLEHLDRARKALADGYKRDRNIMKTAWGRVGDARRHLEAIDPGSKEYKEAQLLMKEVRFRMKEMETVSETLAKRLMQKQREMLADELEFFYLARGYDVRIVLGGPDKSRLTIESPPLCEVFIVKMVRDTEFLILLERAGFKKVTLGDGEGFAWTHNFENEN